MLAKILLKLGYTRVLYYNYVYGQLRIANREIRHLKRRIMFLERNLELKQMKDREETKP